MRKLLLGALLCSAAVACDSDTAGPPEATQWRVADHVDVRSGLHQAGVVGQALSTPISVVVFDQVGNPLANQEVTFHVTSGGGHFTVVVDTTDADGVVESTWFLGTDAAVTHAAEVRVASVSGRVLVAELEALPLPGPFARLRVVGDTIARLERGDSIDVAVIATDAYGNPVTGQVVSWEVADASIATVDGGRVVAVGDGWTTIIATSGSESARLQLLVEHTRSTRYGPVDTLMVAGDELFAANYDDHADYISWTDLWRWSGTHWEEVDRRWPPGYFSFIRLAVSPAQEFWGVFGQPACQGCEYQGVLRSADGQTWEETLRVDGGGYRMNLDFGFDDDVGLVMTGYKSECSGNVCSGYFQADAYLFDGESWTDLDFPRYLAGNAVIGETNGVALSSNGDVYVSGSMFTHTVQRPFIGRHDGTGWTFPTLPITGGGYTLGLEPAPDGTVYARYFDGRAQRVLRIDGAAVELLATPLDTMNAAAHGLAVSPTGELAISYSSPNGETGVIWSTPSGWEEWRHFHSSVRPLSVVWHDGDIWLRAIVRTGTFWAYETLRLDL